jgi:hypothetical protein
MVWWWQRSESESESGSECGGCGSRAMLAQQSAGETAPCSCATTCEPSRAHSRLSTLILPVRVAQVPFSTAARTLVCDDAERHVGTSAHMPPTLCIARPFRSRLAPQLPLRRCASRSSIALLQPVPGPHWQAWPSCGRWLSARLGVENVGWCQRRAAASVEAAVRATTSSPPLRCDVASADP